MAPEHLAAVARVAVDGLAGGGLEVVAHAHGVVAGRREGRLVGWEGRLHEGPRTY